eukprot:c18993_g1_i2.p1 GENE.c18993_g1_i2~~c18993_g1_i2.p1  ORF type:complete len:181 (+),score=32.45 c18993_g1_i2:89-631(+)
MKKQALYDAIEQDDVQRATRILQKYPQLANKDLLNDGWVPMQLAAWEGRVDMIACLAQFGCDVNLQTEAHASPICIAAQCGHVGAVKLLHQLGANPHTACNGGVSPFQAAAANGHVEVLRELVKLGVDIHTSSEDGATPLISAAYGGHVDAVHLLLTLGGNANDVPDLPQSLVVGNISLL